MQRSPQGLGTQRAPDCGEQARRQAALLREAPEEAEALGLIEKLADWNEEG
jgi:hypothetical protein